VIGRAHRCQRVLPTVFGVPSQDVSDEIHVLLLREIVGGVYAPKVSGAMLD
jgi:hypothetical protein